MEIRKLGGWMAAGLVLTGCGADGGAQEVIGASGCQVEQRALALPDGLGEASGAAWSRQYPGSFWSHNDSGGEPSLFLVRASGAAGMRVPVRGVQMRDWEDLALAPCEDGHCLIIGDVGNNGREGSEPLALYTLPEPGPGARWAGPARVHEARFPEGETADVEALFALPDGRIYLITKGNQEPVELYRWPTPLSTEGVATLERVRVLAPEPEQTGDRVTGASASPDGRYVAVRTYGQLVIYRTADLLGGADPVLRSDLMPLGEGQGEGVALANDGSVVLVTESGTRHLPGTAALLSCALP